MPIPKSFIGIVLTLMTVIFAVGTSLIIKNIGDQIPLATLLMYRFMLASPWLILFALIVRGRKAFHINAKRTMMVRICFGCAAMALWFLSVRLLPLGQATALLQSSVIFVTICSPFLLGERIGVYRWSAVITGMFGVMLLTDPFDGGFSIYVIFGVLGAMASAGLAILLRRLGRTDHPFSLAVWYNGSGSVLLFMFVFLHPGISMTVSQPVLFDLVLLGMVATGLQLSITSAFKFAEAVVVTTVRYLQIPLAALIGFLVFAEVMSPIEIVGGCVVLTSCLVIACREFVRSKAVAAQGQETG